MKPAPVVSRTGSAVAFSWELEPGVSKQSPVEGNRLAADRASGTEVISKQRTQAAAETTTAHPHRLRLPPPPGGPGAPAVSPPRRSRARSRGVRPGEDPFLAAYLACTEGGSNGGQKLLGWAGVRLAMGCGLGLHGFGISCKSSYEAVEEKGMVRLAKIPPKFTWNDR